MKVFKASSPLLESDSVSPRLSLSSNRSVLSANPVGGLLTNVRDSFPLLIVKRLYVFSSRLL